MGRTSDAKKRLLRATMELIWEKSYGSVGVEAICEKAGVKKGSFYHFFESKADLAIQALQGHWERLREHMETVFSPAVPPLERLTGYFESVYSHQFRLREKTGQIRGCPYFDLGAEVTSVEGEILARVREILAAYFRYFESAVRDAREQGLIDVPDPQATARYLFHFFEGTLTNARIQDDPELLRDLSAGALRLLGVRDEKTPDKASTV